MIGAIKVEFEANCLGKRSAFSLYVEPIFVFKNRRSNRANGKVLGAILNKNLKRFVTIGTGENFTSDGTGGFKGETI